MSIDLELWIACSWMVLSKDVEMTIWHALLLLNFWQPRRKRVCLEKKSKTVTWWKKKLHLSLVYIHPYRWFKKKKKGFLLAVFVRLLNKFKACASLEHFSEVLVYLWELRPVNPCHFVVLFYVCVHALVLNPMIIEPSAGKASSCSTVNNCYQVVLSDKWEVANHSSWGERNEQSRVAGTVSTGGSQQRLPLHLTF